MTFTPLLADNLVSREDGTMELLLDMKPSGSFSDFVQAVRACQQDISSVHVHRMFMKDLTEEQQADIFDSFRDLKELHVSFVTFPVRLLANLLLPCQQLEKLSLDRIMLVSDPSDSDAAEDALFFSALQGLESLQDFHFSLSAAGVAPEGQKLFFQVDDEFDTLFQSLSGIKTLRKVYISIGQNFANNSDIKEGTLKSLLSTSSIQDLSLVHFPLHKEHCQAIVQEGSSLTSLSLVKAELGEEGASILANGLPNMALQTLCLPGNKLGDRGATSITRALSASVKVLDLHGNQLTAAFGQELATLLETNQNLTLLDVSSNKLGDDGVEAMAAALSSNTGLTQLNLFSTDLTDQSCHAFANVLRVNTTLKKLNLYHNDQIGAAGMKELALALEHYNYDLERLEISNKRTVGDFGLDLYLRLNREFNRRAMKTQATEEEYVQGIHQAVTKRDLSSIFYFLQAKPSLCNAAC